MIMKALKGMLGIPAKSKITGTVLYGKTKHDFPLYQHYKGGLYRLLLVARSEVSGLEQTVFVKSGILLTLLNTCLNRTNMG
nr:MAG TPA: Protein of unknown function (DUF1653) [Caudoviricetes sp.]